MKKEDDQNQCNTQNSADDHSSRKSTDDDKKALAIIDKLPDAILAACTKKVPRQSEFSRVQNGPHNGNCVFFNRDGSDTRFGLTDGVHGSMYVSPDPLTAMKEVFQHRLALKESDLDLFYIGTVVVERELTVLDVGALVQKTKLTLHHVTSSLRVVTHALAKKGHALGLDGIEFPSNVTTGKCLALWADPGGNPLVASTKPGSLMTLNKFKWQGKSSADVIVEELGIPVEAG